MVCQGCRFYRPVNSAAGECRRNPPLVVLGEAAWIVVEGNEGGCGEFIGVAPRQADPEPLP